MAQQCWNITIIRWLLTLICCTSIVSSSTWSEWWTYDGISGPEFWGILNQEWLLCSKGKKQSPIDIEPRHLLFDPHLKHIHVGKHKVSGTLMNDGHIIKFVLDDPSPHYVNISGGPTPYTFRVTEILLHFGGINSLGSEHTIEGQSFPAEIQILGYNSDIYGNYTQAVTSANGLIVIALLAQVDKKPNVEFDTIAQNLKDVRYKGQQVRIRHLSIHDLMPERRDHFMTYEGSLTQPGCFETVTWVVLNRPLIISDQHLMLMRDIMQGDEINPKTPMESNFRPTKELHARPIRTNINNLKKGCSMERTVQYQDKAATSQKKLMLGAGADNVGQLMQKAYHLTRMLLPLIILQFVCVILFSRAKPW